MRLHVGFTQRTSTKFWLAFFVALFTIFNIFMAKEKLSSEFVSIEDKIDKSQDSHKMDKFDTVRWNAVVLFKEYLIQFTFSWKYFRRTELWIWLLALTLNSVSPISGE